MTAAAAAALIRAARSAVALTGAGVSTESGLPDFRSPTGLWAGVDPFTVASRGTLVHRPEVFYAFYRERLERLAGAAPNRAHLVLAAMERAGWLRAVVTQNVDGLHQAAGSRRVIELHGNLREAVCTGCGDMGPIARLRPALDAGTLPRCEGCGALLKPNVVLFDDLLPQDAWDAALHAACTSDLMLVVGSSLQVTPASTLPQETLERGGRLIIVNEEPTPYDGYAAVVLRGRAAASLTTLAVHLGEEAAAAVPK